MEPFKKPKKELKFSPYEIILRFPRDLMRTCSLTRDLGLNFLNVMGIPIIYWREERRMLHQNIKNWSLPPSKVVSNMPIAKNQNHGDGFHMLLILWRNQTMLGYNPCYAFKENGSYHSFKIRQMATTLLQLTDTSPKPAAQGTVNL